MRPSIMSVAVAAILLAGTFGARAQYTDGVSPSKARSTHHSGSNHRSRVKAQTERVPSTADSSEDAIELSYPRLPSVFRNCEHPLPRYCNW